MDLRSLLLLVAITTLVVSLGIYAFKFFKKSNYIIGVEWVILSGSGFNLVIWFFTQFQWQWGFMLFLDAFSRAFGMTLFVIIGMRAATHRGCVRRLSGKSLAGVENLFALPLRR